MKGKDYYEFDLPPNPSPCSRGGSCGYKSYTASEGSQDKGKACSSSCRSLFYSRGSLLLCSAQRTIRRDLECCQATQTLANCRTGDYQRKHLHARHITLVD